MRQYFVDQINNSPMMYYERIANPVSVHPTELMTRWVYQDDVDVMASEFMFIESVHHAKLNQNIPIFERRP